jgi:hypothetical protein
MRAHHRKTLLPVVGVGLGLILIAVALVPWSRSDRTDAPTTFTAQPITSPRPLPASPTAGAEARSASPKGLPVSASAPVKLSLPTVNVRAEILPVVTTDGALGVPTDPSDVGWWTGSVRPGSAAGSVVLDGHVDSAVLGVGVLSHLSQLKANDLVTVQTADGVSHAYRVYSRQSFVKHEGLPAGLFAATGPARLVLITCGGSFDQTTRSYEDNIVVFAVPD